MGACEFTCLSGTSESAKQELFYMIRQELGEPVVNVELADSQLEVSFCKAIREYSTFINNWALENRMSQMLGLPKDIDFTLKYVSRTSRSKGRSPRHIRNRPDTHRIRYVR